MAAQFREVTRNARLDAIESNAGTAVALRVYTGAQPANAAAANSGTLLAHMLPPSDWMGGASGGTKAKAGTWQDTAADSTGTAAHFRIYATDGTTCHIQGTVTVTGGGGDMTLDDVTVESGQQVTISTFTLTAGNA